MFASNDNLEALVRLFTRRQTSLFHACQLIDMESYLRLGGIPSHGHLEAQQARFGEMDTDENDKINGVWDKVFVNLGDFGRFFAHTQLAVTPTVYGPITFQLHPETLMEADDVAICLRSAGAKGFDRKRESLHSVEEMDKLYFHPSRSSFPYCQELKFGTHLEFTGRQDSQWPEVSCTVPLGRLSFARIVAIWVDPLMIDGIPLLERVCAIVSRHGLNCPTRERSCQSQRRPMYSEFAILAEAKLYACPDIICAKSTSLAMKEFVIAVDNANLGYQLSRYLRYLGSGTVRFAKNAKEITE